jgi:hypothetical protein
MLIQYRPMARWPEERKKLKSFRNTSQFKADWNSTLQLLDKELEHLNANAVVIELAVTEREINADGSLRGDARPRHPGVIVSFNSPKMPRLSYPCDTYPNWRHNVRAIALSLEALRAVNRYGVSTGVEQYTGWARLPGPEGAVGDAPPPMSRAEAVAILKSASGIDAPVDSAPALLALVLREAQRKTHPDAGGDAREFVQVQKAKEALGL